MVGMVTMELYPSHEDMLFEEEILCNPFSLKLWWRYIEARSNTMSATRRCVLYERAIRALPGSYKLWHAYLQEKVDGMRGLSPGHSGYEELNNMFERALVTMHKMPRLWIMYLQTLVTQQKLLTRTRRTFDRALCALAVTQHDRIWELYLTFVRQEGVPIEISLVVHRRFLKYDSTYVEDFIEFLQGSELWQEAAERLAHVLNDENFFSRKGKPRHQLWLSLCQLLTAHSKEVSGLPVDAIFRGGILRFPYEAGRLWASLADYYIRCGLFEKARDIFEEGMTSVVTARDFSLVFNSYLQFEESALATKMKQLEIDYGPPTVVELEEVELDPHKQTTFERWIKQPFWFTNEENDVDLRLSRLENLMLRRPELVNSALLRQNPHNVHEWHKRVKLFEGNPTKQVLTYMEAVKTVDVLKAVGKLHTLWVMFAKLYESHADVVNARIIFENAVMVSFKAVDDLASVWCEWAEMELRHKNFKGALDLMKRATAEPSVAAKHKMTEQGEESVLLNLHKSLKLWSFYVDLEESLGTLDSTRNLYERMFDLKIITPQIVLNYAALLEEHKFFEDAFRVYERGVQVFKYPHVFLIWSMYLDKFVSLYRGNLKVERARDLFEQALKEVPEADAGPFYLQFAKFEEEHGNLGACLAVYERATKVVPDDQKLQIYDIYIAKAIEIFGTLSRTRQIYEDAIEVGLPQKDVKTMCIKYAELECSLGEIDRARAIYVYGASKSADLHSETQFWSKWNEFEVQYGNEDTFRKMSRVKRSVAVESALTRAGVSCEYGGMKSLGFISTGDPSQNDGRAGLKRGWDGEEEKNLGIDVAEKSIPDSVFRNLANEDKNSKRKPSAEEILRAKERLKRQKEH